MAERNRERERADDRQHRIKREQHRPEQNLGYDEAVKGASDISEQMLEDGAPLPPNQQRASEFTAIDERETQGAAEDVRRRERSASRPKSRIE